MSDDPTKQGADLRTVAGNEDYEVRYFATKHGLASAQAKDLIHRLGNDRERLDAAAEQLKR